MEGELGRANLLVSGTVIRTRRTPSSYSRYMGMPTTIMVNGSGVGVMTAARMAMATIA